MGVMMMRIERLKMMKGSPMKKLQPVFLCCLVLLMLLPGLAMAQPTKSPGTDCANCHNVATDPATQEIFVAINGVETNAVTVAPGDSFEVDYISEFMRGYASTRGVAGYMGTEATWTITPTTNASNPATIGGYAWNTAWDNVTNQTSASFVGWQANGAGGAVDPDTIQPSGETWVARFDGTAYETTKGAGVDDGTAADVDGTADLMGYDARITVPGGTGVGTYYVYVANIGHGALAGKAMNWATITVTVAAPDSTPPNVTTTVPADSATGVTVDSQVTINWDEPIDCTTVNNTNITFTFGTGSLALNNCSGSQAVFDVSGQTASAAQQVTVSTAVRDVAGNAMSSDFVFFYNTGAAADVTPPNITTTFPTNSATGVVLDGFVIINFDENIDCGTATVGNITSDSPGWSFNTCAAAQAVFNTSGQAPGTLYSVNVSTALTDVAGNPLGAAYPFSFTTAGVANNLPAVPTNPAQYQSNGSTIISVGGYATSTTVVFEGDLFDTDGDTVKLQIDYTGDLAFDCETALVASGTANVQVSCPGLTDGNNYDWSYRAVDNNAAVSAWTAFNGASPDFSVDATAPSVTSTLPVDTEPAAPLNGTVTINFSESVDCAGTVNTTNITSDNPTWTLNNCSGSTAVFDTGSQIALTTYNVSVTSAVTDLAGNALSPAPVNFSYTTSAAVNNAPTVVGSLAQYEADGSTPIAGGGNSATNSVVIEAQIDDSDGDVLILEVDIDSDGSPDCISPAVTGNGTPQALCVALVDGAYDWQVRGKDVKGATSGWSPLGGSPDFNIVAGVDVGIDTTPPIESGLAVTPGDSIIDLIWNQADDGAGSGVDPVNSYKVARSTVATPVDCDTGNIYTGNINAYSDTTVSNGTTYYYLVCAYDNVGNGSAGQAASGTPGSSCTVNTPTVTILTASKDVTVDGGFVDYTIQVTNNDTGACVAPNLDLVLSDDNGTDFYGTTFGSDPLNVAAGASVQTTIRVSAIAGHPNTSANNTYFYTATDGPHAQSANSNTVTTTINVSGGGCIAAGDYLNTNGDQFLTERR
jgi:hypothetical protein